MGAIELVNLLVWLSLVAMVRGFCTKSRDNSNRRTGGSNMTMPVPEEVRLPLTTPGVQSCCGRGFTGIQ
jgi:hypothetical protein